MPRPAKPQKPTTAQKPDIQVTAVLPAELVDWLDEEATSLERPRGWVIKRHLERARDAAQAKAAS